MAEVVAFGPTGIRYWLSDIGDVSDLQWSTTWPGGCAEASWSMDLSPDAAHPALRNGAKVQILDGTVPVWTGRLSEPAHGEPWTLNAKGPASLASNYLCLDSGGNTTSVPQVAVDQAILRGLPWVDPGGLSGAAFTASTTTVDLNTVSSLLDAYATSLGQRWGVFADGLLVVAADATAPTWHLDPVTALMGTADEDYVTDIYARYVSAVTAPTDGSQPVPTAWAIAHVSDAAAADRYGRREASLDLTPLGRLTATAATNMAQGRLTLGAARIGFTEPLTVSRDELARPGGVPGGFEQVRAGQVVRCFRVANSDGNVLPGTTQDILLGEVRYRDGDDSIYLAPVGLAPRSLADVIAAPAPPDDTFTA